MKIVIQCAAGKVKKAGCLKQGGKDILFVAQPSLVQPNDRCVYKSPNDLSDEGLAYQEVLSEYNRRGNNSLHLLPAYKLYTNGIYRDLVDKFGIDNVFILSAGWGLISAGFLTPNYDITFSSAKNVRLEYRRKNKDVYHDLCHLPLGSVDNLLFLGGQSYYRLFVKLTRGYAGTRIVYYNSNKRPSLQHCELRRFETRQKTNWHYSCARKLVDGTMSL